MNRDARRDETPAVAEKEVNAMQTGKSIPKMPDDFGRVILILSFSLAGIGGIYFGALYLIAR